MATIRPWIDPVAIASQGRVTTYLAGTIRDWVDSVAIASKGIRTSYAPGEPVINPDPSIFITGIANNQIDVTGQATNMILVTGIVEG